jgi:cell fate (sporulation/competence/biofilm development) regulator YlbF (YheA/YmcA/DUF963 family)
MKEKYKTFEECQATLNTFTLMSASELDLAIRQLEKLKSAKQAKQVKQDSVTPIYDTLVANYPYGEMPQEKRDCIESTVAQLLEEGEHAEEPGLLLGKIQCGKTDTFEDIIGLAFDKGIDITICFTKGTKPLAEQTLMRMKKDYRFFKSTDNLDQRATINIHDIMNVWKGLKQVNVEGCKTVIVCKKQATNLSHLIDLFGINSPFLKSKKVLIVDDEADFASRNYRSVKQEALVNKNGNPIVQETESEMAKISQQIDDFRKIPAYCRYLQVTATPYCLYLQPQGELNLNGNIIKPFKPRFTSLVPIHSAYVGGKQYFEDSQNPESMYNHLFHQVEQKCIDVLGHEDKRYLTNSIASTNIYGLTYSLVSYFMATAIRRIQIRETENKSYKTSALIHVEIDKKNHEWQQKIINRLIDDIKNAVVDEDQSDQRIWSAIEINYNDFADSNEKGRKEGLISVKLPSLDDILKEIRNIFNPKRPDFHVQVVNSDRDVPTLLDEESGELRLDTAANIFIGGSILDRGITIKNMLCFFYGRNPKSFQQDTVLQHARMYGARSKEDMAVTRLHTTAQIYKILVRMNELDNQLREWFICGKDQGESNAVFVGYDKDIRPCAPQKIRISNALILSKQMRKLPIGFWTGTKAAISNIVDEIDKIITGSANYGNQDANGFFEISKTEVVKALKLIAKTYIYDERFNNLDRKNDITEILASLEYCTSQSGDKIYALHRTNRNMNRVRANGGFIDAPDDGRTDGIPSREKAIDAPVIMFIRQNGAKKVDNVTGDNIGWNNTPFYWPVLMVQENITPVMFALDQGGNGMHTVVDESDILEGIDPSQVIKLTYKGELDAHFGEEGKEHEIGAIWESRGLKDSTASRYIMKDSDGNWLLAPVDIDEEHWHGLYSLNNGKFPFVLRDYKYMLLRNGRNVKADLILLELYPKENWNIIPEGELNEFGQLCDRESDAVLLNGKDTILDANMKETKFMDTTITQWVVEYAIKKVLKFKKNAIDWATIFGSEDE